MFCGVRALRGAAYVKIEDALFDAYSPHANKLPAWYGQQLRQMGLDELETASSSAFLEAELASEDFDRVVHAYYILSHSRLPLMIVGTRAALWRQMVSRAKSDPENRYWISLALAEAKMLPASSYSGILDIISSQP